MIVSQQITLPFYQMITQIKTSHEQQRSYTSMHTDQLADEKQSSNPSVTQRQPSQIQRLLLPHFEESRKSNVLSLEVGQLTHFIEDKAFVRCNHPSQHEYLQFIFQYNSQIKPQFKQIAKEAVFCKQSLVEDAILDRLVPLSPPKKLPQSKHQLYQFQKEQVIKLLQIKDKQIKSKLRQLNDSMATVIKYGYKPPSLVRDLQQFEANSPRKRGQVKVFLKNLKEQKQQRRKRMLEQSIRINLSKKSREQEDRLRDQTLRAQKHRHLEEKMAQMKRSREVNQQKRQQEQENFKQFMINFKHNKPLFKSMEDQFINKQKKMNEEVRARVIEDLRQAHKPLETSDLLQHEKQYLSQKHKYEQRRNDQKRLLNNSHSVNTKQYFKGKFHQLVESQHISQSISPSKEQARKRLQRYKEFEQVVKEKHMPLISKAKQQQLVDLIKLQEEKKVSKESEGRHKQIGIKYLQALRKLTKKPRTISQNCRRSNQTLSEQKSKVVDYLAERRQARKSERRYQAELESPNLADPSSVQQSMIKMQVLSERCRRKQQLLRLGGYGKQVRAQLDQQYLTAIKAKMMILKG